MMRSFICRGSSNSVISTGHTSVDIGASANLEVVDSAVVYCCNIISAFYLDRALLLSPTHTRPVTPQFWANFDIFGGSCTDPLLPMRAKFGEL